MAIDCEELLSLYLHGRIRPTVTEPKAKKETPLVVWLVIGNFFAYTACATVNDALVERAKTVDWVFEYSTWLHRGLLAVYFLIVGVFMLFGMALRKRQKNFG